MDYELVSIVLSDSTDGPATVLDTPGLPVPGSVWRLDDDSDIEAYCKQNARIDPDKEAEPNTKWKVTQKFSNKGDKDRCKEQQITNPLLEPQKVSGSFSKQTVESSVDRFGNFLRNSAQEQLRGAQVEFDESRPSVKIEQNVPVLSLALITQAKDCVNAFPMWGLPARCVKLSGISWDRKFYGQCSVYYVRTFDFEINFDTWDRDLLDEGTKVLNGEWSTVNANWNVKQLPGNITPDRFNPQHFIRFKDRHGENTKVVLDGFGLPWIPPETIQQKWWCINDGKEPYTFFGTCAAMKASAQSPQATITGTSGADTFPITVTTSAPHGFVTGDLVTIFNVQGNTNANGTWNVTRLSATTFSIPEVGIGAYTQGGVAAKNASTFVNGPFNTQALALADCSSQQQFGFPAAEYDCDTINQPGTIHVEKYREMDFFVLGIPATF